MVIRIAEYSDLNSINNIYNQAVDNRISTADLEYISMLSRIEWYNNHSSDSYPILVAVIDNDVVGWASLSPYRKGRGALVGNVEVSYYIHNQFQRMGIGSKLLSNIIEFAIKLNYKNIFAILISENKGSIRLLEKFNFKKWAVLPEFVEIDGNVYDHLYYGLRLC